MNESYDFENGPDGWRFTQSEGTIVREERGNHYITGNEYVTDYSLVKIFKLPFADNLPVTVKFDIKVPDGVTLRELACTINNNIQSLDVPPGDNQWHSREVTFPPPPPQTSGFPTVRITAFQEVEKPPHGLGFDNISVIQE
ncbi:hypothetical protein E3Z27_10250 [Pseudomonas mediterranea]|uniref:Uncharacterized protein n=1 Tax=Pseudomonas mediterranea TaxID=183795 RepID=A0AAX2DFX5_9PSED|nr:hypothetical protein [Pseudomonas mediterranea]KGU82793.1 hypothetical protein N005_25285 [Pseudomonas mediterranea CFBP 5447]MBL0845780.1 hypothetical protein [Pseudomonas mediterranea]QHA82041.1 hypothetical protein E3Z27_10250 [Pseudomonas mediterranea]UZE02973.1 hypothetical protein LOY71_10220 [Pseudomonas mediterranea]CAH0198134.1 hypothetical protein SRABI112_01816 [Pseudomonas mediterranea]